MIENDQIFNIPFFSLFWPLRIPKWGIPKCVSFYLFRGHDISGQDPWSPQKCDFSVDLGLRQSISLIQDLYYGLRQDGSLF